MLLKFLFLGPRSSVVATPLMAMLAFDSNEGSRNASPVSFFPSHFIETYCNFVCINIYSDYLRVLYFRKLFQMIKSGLLSIHN